MSEKDLLNYINDIYGLKVCSISKIDKGFLTDNYVLNSDTEKYFLKCHRIENLDRIEYIEQAEEFFYYKGFPVIIPIKTKQSQSHFKFQDRVYTLYPFFHGGIEIPRDELTDQHIKALAQTLAEMHLSGHTEIPVKFIETNEIFINQSKKLNTINEILSIIYSKKQIDNFDKLALQSLKLKKDFIESTVLDKESYFLKNDCLVHGDFHELNVFFDSLGEVSAIFDFEKAKYEPRMVELARSMVCLCFDHNYSEESYQKAKIYLQEYYRLFPFDLKDFGKSLRYYYLKSLHSVWVESDHYLKNNYRIDKFLERNIKHLEYFCITGEVLIQRIIGSIGQ